MGRILVTGAAGFIGSHLVDRPLAGVDSFTGYYSRERKERNLASAKGADGFSPVEGDVRSTWADSRRAARALNYSPKTGLEEGIADQAAWALRETPVAGTA